MNIKVKASSDSSHPLTAYAAFQFVSFQLKINMFVSLQLKKNMQFSNFGFLVIFCCYVLSGMFCISLHYCHLLWAARFSCKLPPTLSFLLQGQDESCPSDIKLLGFCFLGCLFCIGFYIM